MVAAVGSDDLYLWAVDQETVRLASFDLVVDTHDLVDGQTGVDGVFADEVPVAHPWGAVVAYGAVVSECSGSGKLFGDSFRESVSLRDGEERSAGADGFKNVWVDVAYFSDGLDGSDFVARLVFKAGGVSGILI